MNTWESISTRRSTRVFSPRAVERDKLERIVEAGRLAPSGGNSQSCRFTVVTRDCARRELSDIVRQAFSAMESDGNTYRSLAGSIRQAKTGNYVFHYDAPALIIVSNVRGYGNAMADSACALENMMLMANDMDLGSCWINQLHWLDGNAAVRAYLSELGIPPEETITGSLAVGYPATGDSLPLRKALPRTGNPVLWVE